MIKDKSFVISPPRSEHPLARPFENVRELGRAMVLSEDPLFRLAYALPVKLTYSASYPPSLAQKIGEIFTRWERARAEGSREMLYGHLEDVAFYESYPSILIGEPQPPRSRIRRASLDYFA